jgi:hypothetical protein
MSDFDYSQQYYKIVGRNGINSAYKYKLGLNTILPTETWDPEGCCQDGGLYFTTADHVHRFMNYYGDQLAFISIPKDAKVCLQNCDGYMKWKCDKLIVDKIIPIIEWDRLDDLNYISQVLKTNQNDILKYATERIVLQLNNVCSLSQIKNAYEILEMCLEQVKKNSLALQLIKCQTPEMCFAALDREFLGQKAHHSVFLDIINPTFEICMYALERNPNIIEYIPKNILENHEKEFSKCITGRFREQHIN